MISCSYSKPNLMYNEGIRITKYTRNFIYSSSYNKENDMPKNNKEVFPTNLITLREDLGFTQNELAEILDITPKMISNYETGITNLPIGKALFLAKKFNYSLDWIYENCKNDLDRKKLKNYSEEECIKFLVDIRDFFICLDDKLTLSINNSYWKYINKVNEIRHSSRTSDEKKRIIAQLNGNYEIIDKTNISWEFTTDIDNFISMIKFGQDSSCVFVSDDSRNSTPISEEQIKEAENFLNLITSTIDE